MRLEGQGSIEFEELERLGAERELFLSAAHGIAPSAGDVLGAADPVHAAPSAPPEVGWPKISRPFCAR